MEYEAGGRLYLAYKRAQWQAALNTNELLSVCKRW
jgi:hypothetical protein